jgi:hypothetical protein
MQWNLLRRIHTYHAVPLPCRSAKGLDCIFPIWFTQCGRVWFTHTTAWYVWICLMCESKKAALCKSNGKALSRTIRQGNGMVCVNPPLSAGKHNMSTFRPIGYAVPSYWQTRCRQNDLLFNDNEYTIQVTVCKVLTKYPPVSHSNTNDYTCRAYSTTSELYWRRQIAVTGWYGI